MCYSDDIWEWVFIYFILPDSLLYPSGFHGEYIHLSLLLFTLYKPHKTTYKIRTFKNNPIQKRTVIS